ncbi:MAG TPA: tRNA (N6-threonylcarbamoyladenosine(37)-N6)-methyltransferase TrmO [Ruminococcus sp.]|nr:tRNA (N6-threonylcarbamoyladenosine(37)-N6)-methyltransferase TrmO [Ruminococcus sp.]
MQLDPIAVIRTEITGKFGIPRQSGLVPELTAEIVFLPAYSQPDAVRGLTGFSHIWLIWGFHEAKKPAGKGWSATVRPPRLGGNQRVGVFATRSPFRPNSLGLSCVRLEAVHSGEKPLRLTVSGADLLDGTPIYDIKPYLPFADSIPDAAEGYTAQTKQHFLTVDFPPELAAILPAEKRQAAEALLRQDPRPGYSEDPDRVYGIIYAGYDIRFHAAGGKLTVCAVVPANGKEFTPNAENL